MKVTSIINWPAQGQFLLE